MSCINITFEKQLANDAQNSPLSRMGHIFLSYGKFILLWGGYRHDKYIENKNLLWIFDTVIEKWQSVETTSDEESDMPPNLVGSVSAIYGDHLYIFGGSHKQPVFGTQIDYYTNDLYKLNLRIFKWKKINPKSKSPSPRDKASSWIHDDKLFIFGGFGPVITDKYLNDNGEFSEISNFIRRLGWNNQIVSYNFETEEWKNEKFYSFTPKPRAAHTCVKVNENKVVLFGGRTIECRTNNLHIIDLNNLSCSKDLNEKIDNKQKPSSRSWHTILRLDKNTVLLYGGLSQENTALGDAWLLNVEQTQWTKTSVDFEPRLWHSAAMDRNSQIYVYGGSNNDIYMHEPTLPAHMLKLSFTPDTLKRLSINFICSNLDLFKSQIKTIDPLIPMDLEKIILLRAQFKPLGNDQSSQLIEDSRKEIYRSEYCTIS